MERTPTDGLNGIESAEYERHFAALPHVFLAGNLLRSCPHPFFRDGRLEIVACRYETGDHGEFHWHPEVTEYEYVVEGSVTYVAAETGEIRRFRSGDLSMVQPGICVRRLIEEPCRTLAIKVPSNNVKVHCRQCSRKCVRRVEPCGAGALARGRPPGRPGGRGRPPWSRGTAPPLEPFRESA